jgi:hypothetical protein
MTTSATDTAPRAIAVSTTDADLIVQLADGRTIIVPLAWYPRLLNASAEQRADYRLTGDGEYINWPQVDEDLTVSGLLRGTPAPKKQAGWLLPAADGRPVPTLIPGRHFALRVRDFRKAEADLREKKHPLTQIWELSDRYIGAYLLDPDNHVIEINTGNYAEVKPQFVWVLRSSAAFDASDRFCSGTTYPFSDAQRALPAKFQE